VANGQSFPYPGAPFFSDVPASHLFYPYIQKLKQMGITFGCTMTAFCPGALTSRGQMATFIVRAFLSPWKGQGLSKPT
jgi:hypothetical protein